jgi:hypothetical protein
MHEYKVHTHCHTTKIALGNLPLSKPRHDTQTCHSNHTQKADSLPWQTTSRSRCTHPRVIKPFTRFNWTIRLIPNTRRIIKSMNSPVEVIRKHSIIISITCHTTVSTILLDICSVGCWWATGFVSGIF